MSKSEQEPIIENYTEVVIPATLRWLISIPLLVIVLTILYVYSLTVFSKNKLDISGMGIPEILLFSITVIIVINIPWNKLGFRIKKIGILELEQVVKVQSQSNSNELADLQRQIDDLKKIVNKGDTNNNSELDSIILNFLNQYSSWAFSAIRIKNWGSKQPNFNSLKNYKIQDIRESLRRLLSQNKLKTTISSKGNTLYKLA